LLDLPPDMNPFSVPDSVESLSYSYINVWRNRWRFRGRSMSLALSFGRESKLGRIEIRRGRYDYHDLSFRPRPSYYVRSFLRFGSHSLKLMRKNLEFCPDVDITYGPPL
jgi:hypothetical protein